MGDEPFTRGEIVATILTGVFVMGLHVLGVLLASGEELVAPLTVVLGLQLVVEGVALQGLRVLQEVATFQTDHLTILHTVK